MDGRTVALPLCLTDTRILRLDDCVSLPFCFARRVSAGSPGRIAIHVIQRLSEPRRQKKKPPKNITP